MNRIQSISFPIIESYRKRRIAPSFLYILLYPVQHFRRYDKKAEINDDSCYFGCYCFGIICMRLHM